MIPKFRAWDKEISKMRNVLQIFFDDKLVYISAKNNKKYYCSLDDVELMQSTGMKDKNGVEIFEGDLVKITVSNGFDYLDGNLSIVKKSDYHAGVICELLSNTLEYLITDESETGYRYEVVGNIYENPELLDQSNES